MENLLRKRLKFIKERARVLREAYAVRRDQLFDDLGPPADLGSAVPGREQHVANEPFYLVRVEDADISDDASAIAQRFGGLSGRSVRLEFPRDMFRPPAVYAIHSGRICLFDIETTGLIPNTYVFLCGFMFYEKGRFVVEQVLARDYAEEAGLLHYTRHMMEKYPTWITFNGENFDIPFVKARMAVTHVNFQPPREHIDLFGPARKRFHGVLPNHKLATIERHLRGVGREGDIPGRHIPAAYHRFVRSGDARRMKRIVYHNRMDLLAMAILVNHLAEEQPATRAVS
ncbi:MAG: ribonuclease H-like domain-containing protein [bacterium]|nr:ribonuclease H-like domain-containing protein [bacterium]